MTEHEVRALLRATLDDLDRRVQARIRAGIRHVVLPAALGVGAVAPGCLAEKVPVVPTARDAYGTPDSVDAGPPETDAVPPSDASLYGVADVAPPVDTAYAVPDVAPPMDSAYMAPDPADVLAPPDELYGVPDPE